MSRRGTAHPTPVKDVGLARTSRKWSPESSALPCGNWCDSTTRRRIQRNKEPARHSTRFHNAELLPNRPDKSRKLRRFARARRSAPQNGFRPLRIGLAAGDDVDVQLRHHVAQRGDIDLVALRHFFERQRASAISAIGGKASAPRSASSETTNSSIIGTSDHRIVEIYTLPCAPGGYAVSEQVRTAGPDGASTPLRTGKNARALSLQSLAASSLLVQWCLR